MTRIRQLFPIVLLLLAARCATAPPPGAPAVDQNLIDPRTGHAAPDDSMNRRFDRAWRQFQLGGLGGAQRRFQAIADANRDYLPARLALAAIALQRENLPQAAELIESVLHQQSDYFAAEIYRAELAARQGRLEAAEGIYRRLARHPLASDRVRARGEEIARNWFDVLVDRAQGETDVVRAIALLRQALAVHESPGARLTLVEKLIETAKYEEAMRQIAPLLTTSRAQPEIEAALAEIETGMGEYQNAIARLDRLDRTHPDGRYRRRLDEVKQRWIDANMPPRYHNAVASEALTRAQVAILLYWKLPAVRFAQNLAEPPIAVDIADVAGRDEFVRALALRLVPVDPITREAHPERPVTGSAISRMLARILLYQGAACSAAGRDEINESLRAQKVLDACGIDWSHLRIHGEHFISGRELLPLLDQINRAGGARG
ncbi:MAG TPA: tetratricopeptide repeat protein [Thermoanaerobaculia bacterium]|nr:tetratricopeptide repeat protein [Thermoanaerobaculia bacterium]